MTDTLVNGIINAFGGADAGGFIKEIIVFVISMIPILELRGAILAAGIMNMKFLSTYIIAVIGNIIPVPFVLLFIDKIFVLLKKTKLRKFVERLENKAILKSDKVTKYGKWGLFLFVAVPLPGTGAWTGSLIASLLRMNKKQAVFYIFLGILTAGLIMSMLAFGILKNILY